MHRVIQPLAKEELGKAEEFRPIEGYVFWTPELARSELVRFHRHFRTASSEAVQQNYRKLYKAFERFHNAGKKGFGSWKAFVRSAGLKLDTAWTRRAFLEEVQNYYGARECKGWVDFYSNNTAAATAFRRHRRKWGWKRFGEVLDELGIPHKKGKAEVPTAKSGHQPRQNEGRTPPPPATVVISGEEFSVEEVVKRLGTPAGPVWWKLVLKPEDRKKTLGGREDKESCRKEKALVYIPLSLVFLPNSRFNSSFSQG